MAWAACPCRLDHRAIQEPSAQVVDYQRFYSKAVHGPHGQPILEAAAPHGPRAVPACSAWKRARRGGNPNPLVPSQVLRPETGRGPLEPRPAGVPSAGSPSVSPVSKLAARRRQNPQPRFRIGAALRRRWCTVTLCFPFGARRLPVARNRSRPPQGVFPGNHARFATRA